METENKDQVIDEVVKDQSSDEQSEETKKEPSLEEMASLVHGLQKGYTINAQAVSELKDNLQSAVDKLNVLSGAQTGEDEYLTVGKLRQILNEQSQQQVLTQKQSEEYIDNTLTQLKVQGVIKTKEDEQELLKYAVSKKETDLLKAADRWQEVKLAKEEAKKEVVKTKTQQEEGSKVGTSSKNSTTEQGGVDYKKIKEMDFLSF
jgi:hypothetical protein